jgi:hypothetical protein
LNAAVESNGRVVNVPLRIAGEVSEGTLDSLPEGTYRVRVSGGPGVGSATDIFVVFKS